MQFVKFYGWILIYSIIFFQDTPCFALIIDRLHNYVKEIRRLKKNLEAVSKQNKTMHEAATHGKSEESERDQKDISDSKMD